MNDKLEIHLEIDVKSLHETIESASELNDNDAVFAALSSYALPKKQLQEALEKIETIEAVAKNTIKQRAAALYGEEWNAIKGHGYKISRRPTGAVFNITGKPKKEFVKTTVSVQTKLVEEFVKINSKLPTGIEFNKNRGSSLVIAVDENAQS